MIDIINGKIEQSTGQHQEDILIAQRGHFKFAPHVGVGIVNYRDADMRNDLLNAIAKAFQGDGMKVNGMSVDNGKLNIDAHYTS